MGSAFGANFSAVLVHEGSHVSEAGALAYTQGTDVHFAPGQYEPSSQHGPRPAKSCRTGRFVEGKQRFGIQTS